MVNPIKKLFLLGTQVSLIDKFQLLSIVANSIQKEEKITVLSGNVYAYNLAYETKWYQKILNNADIVRIDGFGVRLGAWILGFKTPPRMTWADFAWDLFEYAQNNCYSIFFLGASDAVVTLAKDRVLEKYPRLVISGTHHGYFNKENGVENDEVCSLINRSHPDILIVGFGMPIQEKWIANNRDRIHPYVVFSGGAVFDYLSGNLKRGPLWMRKYGFEWLARLLIEPKRLWKRYLFGNALYIFRVIIQKVSKNFS